MRTLRTAALLILGLAFASGLVAQTRKVQGYFTDASRPGVRTPQEFDLSALTTGNGAVPAASNTAGVTRSETGIGPLHVTTFTLTSVAVTITDATTNGAHGGVQLYDYPSGVITILGASSDLATLAGAGGIADGAAVLCAVGSAVAATDNATLVGTGEATTIPSTTATLTAGAGTCDGQMTTALLAIEDGSATAKDIFLNFVVPDADSSASDTLTVTGTVTIAWVMAGDN